MPVPSSITLPSEVSNLGKIMEFVSSAAREDGLSQKKISEIELATEEIYVNICKYAYGEKTGDITITASRGDSGRFIIEFFDSGIPFDMTAKEDPDISLDILEREIGGLGIFFVKQVSEEVKYSRQGNMNVLTLVLARE